VVAEVHSDDNSVKAADFGHKQNQIEVNQAKNTQATIIKMINMTKKRVKKSFEDFVELFSCMREFGDRGLDGISFFIFSRISTYALFLTLTFSSTCLFMTELTAFKVIELLRL